VNDVACTPASPHADSEGFRRSPHRSLGSRPLGRWRPRGFTLVQLLIAVALIMGALALLIPAFKMQVQKARSVRCQDNLRRIQNALFTYKEFNNESWPERVVRTQAGLTQDSNVWVLLLIDERYELDMAIFTCPEDPNAPPRWSATEEFYQRAVAHAPSYGLNELTWRTYGLASSDDPGLRCPPAQKDSPSRIILLADRGPDYRSDELPEDFALRRQMLERSRSAGRLPADDDFRVGMVEPQPTWLVPRHGGDINLISRGGTTRSHAVQAMAAALPAAYYDDCFLGGCTFCSVFKAPHYDFSSSNLYFWHGPYDCGSRP
jgi:type II secretory pathway pseudopilin PulG